MNDPADDLTPTLLLSLRDGDDAAAKLLESLYRPALLRFCLGYLGDPALAEDAVQEVFMKVLKTNSVPDAFRVWLFTIARNHCLNCRRRDQRHREELLPSGSKLEVSAAGFLTQLVDREQSEQVVEAFELLQGDEQEMLRLRYGEGLGRDEIAAIVGQTPGWVRERLFRGMESLRRRLGVDSD